MRRALLILAAVSLSACVDTGDDPSNVKDLRVLGVRTDPPEIMTDRCDIQGLVSAANATDAGLPDLSIFDVLDDVTFTTLIADPKGMGRSIDWEVMVCPDQSDDNCTQDPAHTKVLARGSTQDGELAVTVKPGAVLFADGPLLAFTVRQSFDPFRLENRERDACQCRLNGWCFDTLRASDRLVRLCDHTHEFVFFRA